jgi:hypothetical protein
MSTITYTAKRNLVEGGIGVTGDDISADGTGGQFASTTSDLSGLVVDDYIYISGFSNSANNGWHVVSGSSSSTLLPVAASELTTEAAGNTVTVQQYLHLYGDSYDLETGAATLGIWEHKISSENTSQGGLQQSILHRIETGWNFKSDFIHSDDLPYWREFTQSVMGREIFTFDAYGSIATPDNPQSVVMDGNPKWTRINPYYWTLGFKVTGA